MKTWRVYFNRRLEAPHVWSVDEGTQVSEVNVQWVNFFNVIGTTHYDAAIGPNDNTPCAWITVTANAEFTQGGVIFRGQP